MLAEPALIGREKELAELEKYSNRYPTWARRYCFYFG